MVQKYFISYGRITNTETVFSVQKLRWKWGLIRLVNNFLGLNNKKGDFRIIVNNMYIKYKFHMY